MKTLVKIALSVDQCRKDLAEFKDLLDRKHALSERKDILPFFRAHKHLAALVGSYNPRINRFDLVATEFSLFGDFACDLIVGDSNQRRASAPSPIPGGAAEHGPQVRIPAGDPAGKLQVAGVGTAHGNPG